MNLIEPGHLLSFIIGATLIFLSIRYICRTPKRIREYRKLARLEHAALRSHPLKETRDLSLPIHTMHMADAEHQGRCGGTFFWIFALLVGVPIFLLGLLALWIACF